ncbi:MAG TPA: lytic transglycosylase domain-containing protein [Pyrinomonadaceae bacterium]|nr:lytic transglycosylase domain-containing protein [Pyrinomonadaceae bacterium]
MKIRRVIWGGVVLSLLVMVTTGNAASRHGRRTAAKKTTSKVEAGPKTEPLQPNEIIAKLTDGTSLRLIDAHETEQGIWYQRSGITYLVERVRIKTVERWSPPKTTDESNETPEPAIRNAGTPPVWIYLVGGARMEVDTATESTAGVWFTRGPMNIFIERSRIDRIEREDLESLAKSNSSSKERRWTSGNLKIDSLIKQNGAKHGVDPYLIFCVMEQESHFSSRAVSPKGARGLMQLMPGTGARFGVRNPFSPAENIAGGTRYLKQLMNKFNGRVDLVLASYNAGEGAVVKFGSRVPPYRETRDYVRKISYKYHGSKKAEANHPEKRISPSAGR